VRAHMPPPYSLTGADIEILLEIFTFKVVPHRLVS